MAENMQDTKFILRTIELVIWECGWKNIFIKHYQGESDSDAKFFFRTVELTYINNTSKSDIHVPLQHQLVHNVGIHDVQQVWIEVVQVHLVKIVTNFFIFVHLFNETQLRNLVFSRQLFLRTIKGLMSLFTGEVKAWTTDKHIHLMFKISKANHIDLKLPWF